MTLIARRKTTETITWIPTNAHFFNPVSCPINLYLTHYEKVEMSKPLGQQLYELVNKTQFSHGDLELKDMHEWEELAQKFKAQTADPVSEEFTTPDEYQTLAKRTQCDQHKALRRINENSSGHGCFATTLLHGVLGMMGELGELAGALEKWLWYGQKFDEQNFKEELGDNAWYEAEIHNALDASMLETMRANIRKLRARYPDKYDDYHAAEENRDRKEEMKQAFGEENNTARLVVCPSCDSTTIDGESSYPSYVCLSCQFKFVPGTTLKSQHQNGHGWAEPPLEYEVTGFITKDQIDEVVKDTDTFAMKDFPGFPERPMTFDELGGPPTAVDRECDDSKHDLHFWNPFDTARSIADCYAEGQNRSAAYRSIESLENQFNVERCKTLMSMGMAVMKALHLDPDRTTPEQLENYISQLMSK